MAASKSACVTRSREEELWDWRVGEFVITWGEASMCVSPGGTLGESIVAAEVSPCVVRGLSARADWGSIRKSGVWWGVVAEERVLGIIGKPVRGESRLAEYMRDVI